MGFPAMAMVLAILAASPVAPSANTETPSPFDGYWRTPLPCNWPGRDSAEVQKCLQDPPGFDLQLWSTGARLCGIHEAEYITLEDATTGMEEAPTITGAIATGIMTVKFHSTLGGRGEATMRLLDGKLHWDVVRQDDGRSALPLHAVLTKQSNILPLGNPPVCSAQSPL